MLVRSLASYLAPVTRGSVQNMSTSCRSGGSDGRPEKREGASGSMLSPASILAAVPGADSRIVVLAGRIVVGAVSAREGKQEEFPSL